MDERVAYKSVEFTPMRSDIKRGVEKFYTCFIKSMSMGSILVFFLVSICHEG